MTDNDASALSVNKVVVNDNLGNGTGTSQSRGGGPNAAFIAPLVAVVCAVGAVGVAGGLVLYLFKYRKSSDEEPRFGMV